LSLVVTPVLPSLGHFRLFSNFSAETETHYSASRRNRNNTETAFNVRFGACRNLNRNRNSVDLYCRSTDCAVTMRPAEPVYSKATCTERQLFALKRGFHPTQRTQRTQRNDATTDSIVALASNRL